MPEDGTGEVILLVDDEPAIIDACSIGLTRAGYRVLSTVSPHQAIDLAIREPVDLLLSDVMMPGMSGIELLRTVKHIYPDMAAVLMTGHGTMDTAIEALRAGATGFLLKPFNASELRLAVEEALSKSRVLKENVRLKALMPLYESSKTFYGEMSLERLSKVVAEQVAKGLGVDQVSLLLPDGAAPGGTAFRTEAVFPLEEPPALPNPRVLEWIVRTKEPLRVTDGEATNLPAALSGVPRPGPVVYLPLQANGTVVGILRAKRAGSDQHFSDGEIEMLAIQGSQAAIAIQNAMLVRDLEKGYLDSLAALANALEARDVEIRGHCERLSQNAGLIAQMMGLSNEEADAVRVGGLLHDIGKIGIPDAILRKADKLTPNEYAIIKQHPLIGARVLAPIARLQKAIPVVRHHHERYDGEGYPDGLRGEAIPLGARIASVADAFEAITETRVYHPGESIVNALQELRRCRGTQFDPHVIDAFFEVLRESQLTRLPWEGAHPVPSGNSNAAPQGASPAGGTGAVLPRS